MTMARAVILFQQLGAQDVAGHQVRRELHPAELQLQRLAQRTHQQGLAQARNPFQQAVPARQKADQQLLHYILLPDDRLRDGGAQFAQTRELRLKVGFGNGVNHTEVPERRRNRAIGVMTTGRT
ncbi:hypothetical protein D3C87_1561320 [compost metagenome]